MAKKSVFWKSYVHFYKKSALSEAKMSLAAVAASLVSNGMGASFDAQSEEVMSRGLSVESMTVAILLCRDPVPERRVKGLSMLGKVSPAVSAIIADELVQDPDARVRHIAAKCLDAK